MGEKPYSKAGKLTLETSIKKAVFALLDKNPLLSHRMICKVLHLDYNYYKNYLWQLKHKWKTLPEKERGSIPSSRHGWRGWTYLPKVVLADVDRHMTLRMTASVNGWVQSRSRNRFLLFKDRNLGRLQWFETGRVNVYARKPVNKGRVYQLISNGFFGTELLTDIRVLEEMLRGVSQKSQHYVFDLKEPLPKITIDLFGKSNGIVIKIGDRSHPNSVEVISSYPDWQERNELLFNRLMGLLEQNLAVRVKMPERVFVV